MGMIEGLMIGSVVSLIYFSIGMAIDRIIYLFFTEDGESHEAVAIIIAWPLGIIFYLGYAILYYPIIKPIKYLYSKDIKDDIERVKQKRILKRSGEYKEKSGMLSCAESNIDEGKLSHEN